MAREIKNKNELTITRIFDASREKVWKAWTAPEEIKKWWGPKYFTIGCHTQGTVWRRRAAWQLGGLRKCAFSRTLLGDFAHTLNSVECRQMIPLDTRADFSARAPNERPGRINFRLGRSFGVVRMLLHEIFSSRVWHANCRHQ